MADFFRPEVRALFWRWREVLAAAALAALGLWWALTAAGMTFWLAALVIVIGLGWGGIALLFVLVPVEALSIAEVTIFSALLLFAHALPIEQKIIAKAGPRFVVTSLLRLAGGVIYALILHNLFQATGWLSDPVNPAFIPAAQSVTWLAFLWQLAVLHQRRANRLPRRAGLYGRPCECDYRGHGG